MIKWSSAKKKNMGSHIFREFAGQFPRLSYKSIPVTKTIQCSDVAPWCARVECVQVESLSGFLIAQVFMPVLSHASQSMPSF